VKYIQEEVMARASAATDASRGGIVPLRRTFMTPASTSGKEKKR
jgi:hypothetical protein